MVVSSLSPHPFFFSDKLLLSPTGTVCALDKVWGTVHTLALPGTSSSHLQLLSSCVPCKTLCKRHLLHEVFPDSPLPSATLEAVAPSPDGAYLPLQAAMFCSLVKGNPMRLSLRGSREISFFSVILIPSHRFPGVLRDKGLVLPIFLSMVPPSGPRTKVCSKELLVIWTQAWTNVHLF